MKNCKSDHTWGWRRSSRVWVRAVACLRRCCTHKILANFRWDPGHLGFEGKRPPISFDGSCRPAHRPASSGSQTSSKFWSIWVAGTPLWVSWKKKIGKKPVGDWLVSHMNRFMLTRNGLWQSRCYTPHTCNFGMWFLSPAEIWGDSLLYNSMIITGSFLDISKKNSSPKNSRLKKTHGNFLKNSSLFSKNSKFCQLNLIIFEIQKIILLKWSNFSPQLLSCKF